MHIQYSDGTTTPYSGNVNPFSGSGRKMGFMAHDGSTVWGLIDSNFNGISDYIEGLDADGDGLFDALENALGTRFERVNNQLST